MSANIKSAEEDNPKRFHLSTINQTIGMLGK